MLVFSAALSAVDIYPRTYVSTPGGNASYTCYSDSDVATITVNFNGTPWNGMPLGGTNVTFYPGGNVAELILNHISSNINNTHINCEFEYRSRYRDNQSSENASLQIQG